MRGFVAFDPDASITEGPWYDRARARDLVARDHLRVPERNHPMQKYIATWHDASDGETKVVGLFDDRQSAEEFVADHLRDRPEMRETRDVRVVNVLTIDEWLTQSATVPTTVPVSTPV